MREWAALAAAWASGVRAPVWQVGSIFEFSVRVVSVVRCQWLKNGEWNILEPGRGCSGLLVLFLVFIVLGREGVIVVAWGCDVVWLDDVDAVGLFFVLVFSFFLPAGFGGVLWGFA